MTLRLAGQRARVDRSQPRALRLPHATRAAHAVGWFVDGCGGASPDRPRHARAAHGARGRTPGRTTRLAGRAQSGYLFHYAFAMVLGIVALVTWMTLFGGAK